MNDTPDEFFPDSASSESPVPVGHELDLADSGTQYLIRQRIENLREQIGLTVDEMFELRELETLMKPYEEERAAIPEGLGVPSREDQFIAALEAKRANRRDDAEYAGGEIEEQEEPAESSVNQWHQNLLRESRLNLKSFALLSPDRKPVLSARKREATLFDLYETLPPKYTFPQFLASLWQAPEQYAVEKFGKQSEKAQYDLRLKWQEYLERRRANAPSPLQQVLFRCRDLVTSPVYDGIEETQEEHYRLANGAEFRFTDKTVVFTLPFAGFEDIPRKPGLPANSLGFLEVSFLLPEYARERKRFFKKGGSVEELTAYLQCLGVEFSEKQARFLHDLAASGALRLYREVLELADHDEIRGYFLNVRKDFGQHPQPYIRKCLEDRLKRTETVLVRMVTPFHAWFPEWMRKIGGIIVEAKSGRAVSLPKPVRIGVDEKLPAYSVRREPLFLPSPTLLMHRLPPEQWRSLFVAEMRSAYKTNPRAFQQYAHDFGLNQIRFKCGCPNHGSPHQEHCPVPILEGILRRVWESISKRR